MTRREIFEAWANAHVVTDDGLAFRMDDAVEQLYYDWRRRGAPEYAYVSIEGGSTNVIVSSVPDLE